jgi:hypothetical protein
MRVVKAVKAAMDGGIGIRQTEGALIMSDPSDADELEESQQAGAGAAHCV